MLDMLYLSHHDNDANIFNNRLEILRLISFIVLIFSMNDFFLIDCSLLKLEKPIRNSYHKSSVFVSQFPFKN